MKSSAADALRREREEAWLGDAVLALYARAYILRSRGGMDQEEFAAMTSNFFLSALGQPTRVEAAIGRIYQTGGLETAFAFIEQDLLPLYLKQRKNRR